MEEFVALVRGTRTRRTRRATTRRRGRTGRFLEEDYVVVCREEGACCLDCEGQGEEEDEEEAEHSVGSFVEKEFVALSARDRDKDKENK